MSMKTLYSRLEEIARKHPEEPAIVAKDQEVLYRVLLAASDRLARELKGLGIHRGSRVALLLPNGARFVSAFFAVAHLGGIVVPINPSYKELEMVTILKDGEVSVILAGEEFHRVAQAVAASNA